MTGIDTSRKLAVTVRRARAIRERNPKQSAAIRDQKAQQQPTEEGTATIGRSPPSTIDKPWENLHPTRVWPD